MIHPRPRRADAGGPLADGPDVGIDLVSAETPDELVPGVLALAPFASAEVALAEAAGRVGDRQPRPRPVRPRRRSGAVGDAAARLVTTPPRVSRSRRYDAAMSDPPQPKRETPDPSRSDEDERESRLDELPTSRSRPATRPARARCCRWARSPRADAPAGSIPPAIEGRMPPLVSRSRWRRTTVPAARPDSHLDPITPADTKSAHVGGQTRFGRGQSFGSRAGVIVARLTRGLSAWSSSWRSSSSPPVPRLRPPGPPRSPRCSRRRGPCGSRWTGPAACPP